MLEGGGRAGPPEHTGRAVTTWSGVTGAIGATFSAPSGGGGCIDGACRGDPVGHGATKDGSVSFTAWRTGPEHGTPGAGRFCRWMQAMSDALSDA